MGKKRVATIKGDTTLKTKAGKIRKKKKRNLGRARIFINASYNNTKITVTDDTGDVVVWTTAGSAGFKGPRKATPYAAQKVVDLLLEKLEGIDVTEADIYVKGIGSGRDSALRALTSRNLNIISIKDITSVPHNGCRPPKRRRV